jgi:nucleotide-binding universal stress UspA family protein
MGLFSKILVPVDSSRYSRDAVRVAAKIAKFHGSGLKLFHVLDTVLMDRLKSLSKQTRETIREELRHNAQGFLRDMEREVKKEIVDSEVLIREGVPHEAILKEASAWGADLIVMGKLGRRGISHILLGSVTERVIEFSDVPVLVVK